MFWRVATTETVTSLNPCYCSLVSKMVVFPSGSFLLGLCSVWGAIVFICFFSVGTSPGS